MPSLASVFAHVAAASAAALGIAAALRAKRSLSRWAFAAGMFTLAAEAFLSARSVVSTEPTRVQLWQSWRLVALSFLPAAWILFSFSYARGAGHFARNAKFAFGMALALPAGFYAFGRANAVTTVAHPDLTRTVLGLGSSGILLHVAMLVAAVLVIMNLERTFRASVGTVRWRIKYMLFGVAVIFVARIYLSSQVLVFRGVDLSLEPINSAAVIVGCGLIFRSFLRAGHFEIDVYPSQAVLQSSATVLVTGVYLLIVGALARFVSFVGGDAAFPIKAFVVLVALVSLAVFLQSDRVRLQLRQFVSRHFERPMHDYRLVWKKFAECTASCVEKSELSRALVRMIADSFQALSVSIWLPDETKERLTLIASTSANTSETGSNQHLDAAGVAKHFRKDGAPADIELLQNDWCMRLRELHRGEFHNGGHRVCVPIMRDGELLGIIAIADRVSGAKFTAQDFDLLKCIADHTAASLANVQLSQRLLQAKELEAFQCMAAFFVHDLKNAASTLTLMLKNLPVHFDDPEFRADALRGISKTVTHINDLIGRLGVLRHELKINPADADLNEIVKDALSGLGQMNGARVVKEMKPLPRIAIDPGQVSKVITNLVLNASQAIQGDGMVRVGTEQENGWVVLTVADNGCGMSPAFLSQSLFRPFQTTKKNGLGIGMFQSKMIIEAHGGRISVTSEQGKGTTFQVFLPASATRTA